MLAAFRRRDAIHAPNYSPRRRRCFHPDVRGRVLLIRRADNGMWALPGGFHDLHETPAQCAVRECQEETGLLVRLTRLLGVFSSNCYEEVNYPHKGGKYVHIVFMGMMIGGNLRPTAEAKEIGWFGPNELPELSDGHGVRIAMGFHVLDHPNISSHFE